MFHCNIGIGCYDFGLYADAASHYFDALGLIEKYRTPELLNGQRDVYHNIAGIYSRLGDSENAILYVEKAIQSSRETHQDPGDHYSMLGWIYLERKDYQDAVEAFKATKSNADDFNRIAEKTYGLATCYRNLGDLESALPLAQKAVELLPIAINVHYGSAAMHELAACEFAAGMTDQALEHALLAYASFSKGKNNRGASEVADLLSNIYKSEGDFKKALEYSEERYRYQFQVERQQSNRQLAFGEFTRDNAAQTAKREAEVKAELNRQRYIRYALFAGLGILAILAYLLYTRYRFKQRTTEQLEIKNKEVEAARHRAEASEAFKSRFLANMSHEIRTPLHGISGFTELLLDTSLSDKQNRWLSSIQYSTDRLSDVVNDILDISKLEAGEVKLRQIPFSPSRLLTDVQDALRLKAVKNGTQIKVSIAEDVPIALLGDPTRLYQILMNLAGNAVKFTENGTITLSVKSTDQNSLSHTSPAPLTVLPSHPLTPPAPLTVSLSHSLTLSVTDTGIGIPPERLSAIFESFQQAGEDTTARFGGTGLGLTIARELVRLHGSDIHVESEVGKGSSFYFTVTLPEADPEALSTGHQAGDTLYFTEPLRILLADDNALNREIAVEAIRRHFENAEVIEAVNGKEVVDLARQNDFNVVLMDMQMPVMTGAEATIHIRTRFTEGKRLMPIIALTASATPEEIETAIQSGMNRHLGKPFKSRELAHVIAETLGLSSVKKFTIENKTMTDTTMPSPDQQPYDLAFLFEFTEGDKAQMIHFIQKFLDNYPKEIGTIEQALRDENRDALYLAAHSFRPQLEFVGMNQAATIMLSIEKGARDGSSIADLGDQFSIVTTALRQLPAATEWV
ncbi:MAG: response regulator [Saprospiraceae bacterium]|nr:response regulator [Candidatus Opimibacter iunctus]